MEWATILDIGAKSYISLDNYYGGQMDGYCFKCGEKREMKDPKGEIKRSRGTERRFASGTCSVCGTKMYKAVKRDEFDALGI